MAEFLGGRSGGVFSWGRAKTCSNPRGPPTFPGCFALELKSALVSESFHPLVSATEAARVSMASVGADCDDWMCSIGGAFRMANRKLGGPR